MEVVIPDDMPLPRMLLDMSPDCTQGSDFLQAGSVMALHSAIIPTQNASICRRVDTRGIYLVAPRHFVRFHILRTHDSCSLATATAFLSISSFVITIPTTCELHSLLSQRGTSYLQNFLIIFHHKSYIIPNSKETLNKNLHISIKDFSSDVPK